MTEIHPAVVAVLDAIDPHRGHDHETDDGVRSICLTCSDPDGGVDVEYFEVDRDEAASQAVACAVAVLRWATHELDPDDARIEGPVRWMHHQIHQIEGGCPDGCPTGDEIEGSGTDV